MAAHAHFYDAVLSWLKMILPLFESTWFEHGNINILLNYY